MVIDVGNKLQHNYLHLCINYFSHDIFSITDQARKGQFKCKICEAKTFSRQSDLERHKMIHSGAKLFFCDVCNKGFARRDKLKDHSATHTGVKPYVCGECLRGFAARSKLTRHMLRHAKKLSK